MGSMPSRTLAAPVWGPVCWRVLRLIEVWVVVGLFAVGGGGYSPVSGGGDPEEYAGPQVVELPPACRLERVVVTAN